MSITWDDVQRAYENGREEGATEEAIAWRETTRPEAIAEALHEGMEHQFDECDHGTYSGGPFHGKPYKMCGILAEYVHRSIK